MTADHNRYCPIARTSALIGDSWTPLLLRELLTGAQRFDQLTRSVTISRAVLTDRLRKLTEHGVVDRVPYQQRPIRHEYVLTEKGHALCDVLLAMWGFGDEWLFSNGAYVELVDTTTGQQIKPIVIDQTSGNVINPRNTQIQLRS